MEATPYPQGPQGSQPNIQPKTSGLAIASLVCGILALCLGLPGLLGLIFGIIAIRKINGSGGTIGGKGLAIGGMVTSGLGVGMILLSAILLLPILAKAKNKANRMKCANNLATIGKAYHAMSGDIDGDTPHLYGALSGPDGNKLAQALGYDSLDDPYDTTRWMSAHAIRQSLYTPKSLVSPLDPEAIAAQRRMGVHEFADGSPVQVSSDSQSYAIAMQGDLITSDTLLIITRNIKNASDAQRRAWYQSKGGRNNGDIWMYPNGNRPWSKHIGAAHIQDGGMSGFAAEFHGEDGNKDDTPSSGLGPTEGPRKHTMDGLSAGEANWGSSDGATRQGSSYEFNDQLRRARSSFNQGSAIAPGLNLTVLRPQQ